ncbi:hypothetical protein [Endozoicomonas euniceicola]|uniref:Uncharacterized protein n=1 Tax=Endozoicomonas euniceicola TaxID=1234143 RepID=A0ABY6GWR8_9GAMM|nr:hypothetical protein [Endozoicomonas euniceicola]UYM17211.1 hypothetical protein NX720_04610 [Endozoicomonas euniceicola]
MFAFLRFVVSIVFLIGLAEAGEFRIDVYNATGFLDEYFTEGKQAYEYSRLLTKFQELEFIRSIQVDHNSSQYFICANSHVQRSPEIPVMTNPALRRETLKSTSKPSEKHRKKQLPAFLGSHSDTEPHLAKVEVSKTNNHSFSVKRTWPNGKTLHRKMAVDPLSMINFLIDVEDCMGRRDVRFDRTDKQWRIKSADARVMPGLSKTMSFTRGLWDQDFYDGLFGVDKSWSIYAVVLSSEESVLWNGRMAPHQVVIGFQLVNLQSHSNLFIQMTNWANDARHGSYNYLDPEASAACPLLSESQNQVDGNSQWTLYLISIFEKADTANNEIEVLPPHVYFNKGFRDDDDPPAPAGASHCRSFTLSSCW